MTTETITTLPTLSPSRAADFKTCPLLYRFRSIDRLPERPTPDQMRGTLVHAVLEALFEEPTGSAPPSVPPRSSRRSGSGWWRPRRASPTCSRTRRRSSSRAASCSAATSPSRTPTGSSRPSGRRSSRPRSTASSSSAAISTASTSPPPATSGSWTTRPAARPARRSRRGRMFQLKFYALVLWRTRGVVPRVLRLMYLKDREVCDFSPDAEELERFERTLLALWQAIERATARPRLPGPAEPAVRVVRASGAVPGVRRDPAAVPGAGRGASGAAVHGCGAGDGSRRVARRSTPPPWRPPRWRRRWSTDAEPCSGPRTATGSASRLVLGSRSAWHPLTVVPAVDRRAAPPAGPDTVSTLRPLRPRPRAVRDRWSADARPATGTGKQQRLQRVSPQRGAGPAYDSAARVRLRHRPAADRACRCTLGVGRDSAHASGPPQYRSRRSSPA